MSDTLFLAPLRLEQRAIRAGARQSGCSRIGMGPERATAAYARFSHESAPIAPTVLLGFGGGLISGLAVGDLVVADRVLSMDGESEVHLPESEGVASLLRDAGLSVRVAPIVSAREIVSGDQARTRCADLGAIAVDMEALWCAPLAQRQPFVVVRSILDVVGRDLISFSTPRAFAKAYRSLVAASRVLAQWSPKTTSPNTNMKSGDL